MENNQLNELIYFKTPNDLDIYNKRKWITPTVTTFLVNVTRGGITGTDETNAGTGKAYS